MELIFQGQSFIARADRTLHWPKHNALLAADLHWGKDSTFRAHGIPVSRQHLQVELDRLIQACRATQAEQLWVLGDLCHGLDGLDAQTEDRIQSACQHLPRRLLVEGNHDQHLQAQVRSWGFEWCHEGHLLDGIALRHHPGPGIHGHLHPTHWLRQGRERLRLPCFRWGPESMVLPAFTGFSNGPARALGRGENAIVIAGTQVFRAR